MRFLTTNQFEKDYRRMIRQGKDMDKVHAVMEKLIEEERLEARCQDHALSSNFRDRGECHIEAD